MNQPATPSALRPRPLGRGSVDRRLVGKVVLVDVGEPACGIELARRYAREGADLAICHHLPSDEMFALQEEVESSGARCVLYEILLDDEWNCGLVLQSVNECLGTIDLVVNRRGHVVAHDVAAPMSPSELLDFANAPATTGAPATPAKRLTAA